MVSNINYYVAVVRHTCIYNIVCVHACARVHACVCVNICACMCYNIGTLEQSFEHGQQADLCLAMGSSLTVTPAADIPEVRRRSILEMDSVKESTRKKR